MSDQAAADRRGEEGGSASIWVISAMALIVVIATVTAVRSAAVVVRHRAESAADLAALAAAGRIGIDDSMCGAAAAIARRNGARLVRCVVQLNPDLRSGTVTTEVAIAISLPFVGGQLVKADARAQRLPGRSR